MPREPEEDLIHGCRFPYPSRGYFQIPHRLLVETPPPRKTAAAPPPTHGSHIPERRPMTLTMALIAPPFAAATAAICLTERLIHRIRRETPPPHQDLPEIHLHSPKARVFTGSSDSPVQPFAKASALGS